MKYTVSEISNQLRIFLEREEEIRMIVFNFHILVFGNLLKAFSIFVFGVEKSFQDHSSVKQIVVFEFIKYHMTDLRKVQKVHIQIVDLPNFSLKKTIFYLSSKQNKINKNTQKNLIFCKSRYFYTFKAF